MVGRYFRCGRDADTSDGDVCFVMFHFLIFKLSLTCDESQETGEGIWSGNRPNPFLVLHSSPLREQETCDFLRYKMHSGRGNHAPTQVMLRKRYANYKVCATSQFSVKFLNPARKIGGVAHFFVCEQHRYLLFGFRKQKPDFPSIFRPKRFCWRGCIPRQ